MQIQPNIATSRNAVLAPVALLSLLAVSGCSGPVSEPEAVAEISQAINVCDETVPANRYVDGFPAYAQCADTSSSAIWSNNGIDTALSSQGAGWVRTQRSGGYQCTEWAWRYMHFRWGIDYQNGNAGGWCDGNLPATLTKATVPVHGDLIVFAPGVCGADGTTGHIAVIDVVNASAGTVTLVEENNAGRRNAKISCATCFLHAVANDGSGSGGAAGSGGSSTSTTGGNSASGGRAPSGGNSASGGRAPSGGDSATGGAGPLSSGGASAGGASAAGGAASGGVVATGGMLGHSGAPGSSGGATSGGNPSTGGSSASGGTPGSIVTTGGNSSGGSTANSSGAPTSPGAGQASAGMATQPLPDAVHSGCSVGRTGKNVGFGGAFAEVLLAICGLGLRRRSRRRRGFFHAA